MSKCWIWIPLYADASARSMDNFRDKFLLDKTLFSDQFDFMKSNTICTSQRNVYLGWGDLELKTPESNSQTLKWAPTFLPSIGEW